MFKRPTSLEELLKRSRALSGLTLSEIAEIADFELHTQTLRGKGRTGELIEKILGADGGSKPIPDFSLLGVEMKTVPVRDDGRVLETTFVCSVPLKTIADATWETSRAYKKLAHVLFVPVEGDRKIEVAKRRCGQAFLWQPSVEQNRLLAHDWSDFQHLVNAGLIDATSARRGKVMQVRPKAQNAKAKTHAPSSEGDDAYQTLPRGFYLRRDFVEGILRENLAC